ncbi:MAG: hypothetical protein JSW49_03055 [candidate division WOR-3 bacterium]|nr:MAG: hypothetical protein JSW49_03055 [candidate division WOR-3 bacterium]
MKMIILLSLTLCLCLFAEETYLGMVHGIEGDSLVLVDGLRIYVPNARASLVHRNLEFDVQNISFPFTASLVRDRLSRTGVRTYIRIEKLYEVVDGRLIEKR